ncbi:mechanosensitive ion channel family protein [Reinekea blandensis]|uniref:Small-conductance mechanosensitive channel n=1 Tax=Reinekea blandensis MED297 TaxID=314283 RepID=A4BBA8_9GAMM|nr:mechanosensitive ion channel family protein [Reinekea blandensis]EAR10721.1 transporter, small conductance mechanosensitive ion channel (MscS) family protein [Reinekea sp. MED297] [Reinekea blandensis MED297]
MDVLTRLNELIESTHLYSILQAILLLTAGYVLGKLASTAAVKISGTALSPHSRLILKRAVFYVIFGLLSVSALSQLGFDLNVILGAAGILTVALGFASQTSASNLISGLFLMLERPFSIGDIIRVNATSGEVISIDLLSVKLRTFDNLFVRIPNETMLKTEVTTLTKYPIRRADLLVGVAYREDIERVRDILMDIAAKEPLCLEEPKPLFIFSGFGNSSIDIQFSVWAQRENFLTLKNNMLQAIKIRFDQEGIEIPFPHVSFYTGSDSRPLPVSLVNDAPADPS